MAEETAQADAQDAQAAQVAEQEAQVQAAQPRNPAPPADVADEAPDDTPADRAPRVWLAYNPASGSRYNHIPTQGSGVGGELTPDEVQAYFTRAAYDQATKIDKTYSRARKAELRPTAPQEVNHGES